MVSLFPELSAERFYRNRLFTGIDHDVLEKITAEMAITSYERDEIIFREGDRGDVLYLVGEGSVKISKLGRGGRQETLGFIEAGNFFGEMALLDGEPRSAMAAAAGPTVLGVVNEETFQRILENAPSQLHLNFLRSVTQRLRQINSHFITEVMRSERLSTIGSMAGMILHDLNNPICTVRCCCEVMTRESDDPNLHKAAALLQGAVDGMLGMTQELLDYTRGSIHLQKRPTHIGRLLGQLAEQSLPVLREKNVELILRLGHDQEIEMDQNRMLRVLGNLVKNAREAMPGGGSLTITSSLEDEDVLLQITDTGVGIPTKILPQLFEPFVTHGKANGTGLGMAIAKSVVEAHGGKIAVLSRLGSGTTVEVRLPTARTAAG